ARPDRGMAVEDQRLAVGRVAAPEAPVEGKRLFEAAGDGDLVQHGDARERAVAARGAEDHVFRVAAPADHLVVAGVIVQPLRRAAADGNDEHVVVAVAVRRKGDPLAVGREPRIDLARQVVGDTVRIAAVLVGGPDVAEIAEGDLAGVIVGMAGQPYRRGGERRGRQREYERRGSGRANNGRSKHIRPPGSLQAGTCRGRAGYYTKARHGFFMPAPWFRHVRAV